MWLNLARLESLLDTTFIGRRLAYLTSTPSTQDIARDLASAGAREGLLVLAEEQTAGRGRFGRAWVSPAGQNLYFTLLLRPTVSRLRALTIVAPLAAVFAIEDVTQLPARIKWPNDVQINGRKLAGVLVESELAGSEVRFALVGIGLNVNLDIGREPEIAGIATSIKAELGREVEREEILAALLNHFERLYESCEEGTAVFSAWRERMDTLGKQVTVRFRDQRYEGLAEDVDGEGNLILRRDDGSIIRLEAGEVSLRSDV